MTEEEIGHTIIGAAIRVHSVVGPGFLENAYETCLIYELEKQRLSARRQVLIPIRYEDLTIDNGYRIDLLVGDRVVVELKAVEAIFPYIAASFSAISNWEVSSWVTCLISMSRISATVLSELSMGSDVLRPLRILSVLCGEVFLGTIRPGFLE